MEPRIETLVEKRLIGKRLVMTMAQNRTAELWRSFMQRRKEVKNVLSSDLFSVQVYAPFLDFKDFNLETPFEKWAAVEVAHWEDTPVDMDTFILEGGLYAVFLYKGAASNFQATFHSIFHSWLPNSNFELDNRAHFEVMGEKYKHEDPSSEEEIWIPIKTRN